MQEERESSQRPKPLLITLPAELRNRIYALVVIKDEPIAVCLDHRKHRLRRSVVQQTRLRPNPPALARVYRLVRNDVWPIFRGANVFVFKRGVLDAAWTVGRHAESPIRWMRHVRVEMGVPFRDDAGLMRQGPCYYRLLVRQEDLVWAVSGVFQRVCLCEVKRKLRAEFKRLLRGQSKGEALVQALVSLQKECLQGLLHRVMRWRGTICGTCGRSRGGD